MNHGTELLRKYENDYLKITAEERRDGMFLATIWLKDNNLENDRTVFEFETFGGAMDRAFDLLSEYCDFIS